MQKLPEAKPLIAHFSGAALARMSFAAADASRSSGARAESARDEACVSEVWRASRVSTDHFAVHPPFSTSTSCEWQRAYFSFRLAVAVDRRNRRPISRFAGLRGACRPEKKFTLSTLDHGFF
jgi:hypothetical protein